MWTSETRCIFCVLIVDIDQNLLKSFENITVYYVSILFDVVFVCRVVHYAKLISFTYKFHYRDQKDHEANKVQWVCR